MKQNILYEKNMKFLQEYPYIHFSFNIIPADDIYINEKETHYEAVIKHNETIIIQKNGKFDYEKLFNNEKMELENLLDVSVFVTLSQILRESEKCGFDNRVYIRYDKVEYFLAVAKILDLSEVFQKGQFYILFGDEQIVRENIVSVEDGYRMLDIDEMQSIVFFYQPSSCGYEFFREIIKQSSYVVWADGWNIHRKIEETLDALGEKDIIKEVFHNDKRCFSGEEFLTNILRFPQLLNSMNFASMGVDIIKILNYFYELFGTRKEMCIADIMKALFISKFYAEHPMGVEARIVPIIVFSPDHFWRFMDYYSEIKKKFRRVIYFRTVRNPVIRAIRAYEYVKKKKLHHFVKYINNFTEELYFDQYSVNQGNSYSVKFEDLKECPQEVLKKVCLCFRIPYEDKLIQKEYLFDKKAVSPDLDPVFSDMDIEMLAILYSDYMTYYNYDKAGKCDEKHRLLGYKFGFEKEFADLLMVDEAIVHMVLQKRIKKYLEERNNIPKFPIRL